MRNRTTATMLGSTLLSLLAACGTRPASSGSGSDGLDDRLGDR